MLDSPFKELGQQLSSIAMSNTNTSSPFTCIFVVYLFGLFLFVTNDLISSFSTPPLTGPRVCSPWCACKRRRTFVLSPWVDGNGTESQTGLSRYCYSVRTGWKRFFRPSQEWYFFLCNRKSRNLATTLTAIGGSILGKGWTDNFIFRAFGRLKLPNISSVTGKSCEHFDFLVTLAAYSTVRELRMQHDLWCHQKDIPWAHTGGVRERKRWRNSSNRLVEKTGQ